MRVNLLLIPVAAKARGVRFGPIPASCARAQRGHAATLPPSSTLCPKTKGRIALTIRAFTFSGEEGT